MGWSVRDSSGATNLSDSESDLPATAGFPIATVTITGPGNYDVNWTVGFTGPVAASDALNNQLKKNAALILNSLCPVAAGVYPQPSAQVSAVKNDVIAILPQANGTAGVEYFGQLTVGIDDGAASIMELQDGNSALAEMSSPVSGAASVWLGPQGVLIANQITGVVKTGGLSGAVFVQYYRGT